MRRSATRLGLAAVAVGGAVALVGQLAGGSAPAADRPEAGRVHLFREGGQSFERWVHRRDCGRHLARYHRMRLYPPHADACVRGGYRGALAYLDAQAIYPYELRIGRSDRARVRRAKRRLAQMILRDRSGRRLYVPYGCAGGRCPQFAANIGRRAWRERVARQVGSALRKGYRGVFLDDVNWNVNTSDGTGRTVAPVDPVTGEPIGLESWRRALARLVSTIRERHPRAEVMVNSVWWKPESSLASQHVARGVGAATHFELERGTLDTFRGQSYSALLGTIDRLHALGLGVNLDNFAATTRRQAEFELGTYFLVSEGNDSVGAAYGSCPSSSPPSPCEEPFWRGWRTDLGAPDGRRRDRSDGLLERRFARGLVLLNPPGGRPHTVVLEGPHSDLAGVPRGLVELDGGEAAVLRR